jgi:hypothetical protein
MSCKRESDPSFELEVRSHVDTTPECTVRPSEKGVHHIEAKNWHSMYVDINIRSVAPGAISYADGAVWGISTTLDPRGKKKRRSDGSRISEKRDISHSSNPGDCEAHEVTVSASYAAAGGTSSVQLPAMHLHLACR